VSRRQQSVVGLVVLVVVLATAWPRPAAGAEAGRGDAYSVVELIFRGPLQSAADCPARDIDFRVRFRHESGSPEYVVHGFHDGDGDGGAAGRFFKIRFCPTKPGRWDLAEVRSNIGELNGQRQGETVMATRSGQHGFWEPDPENPTRRWYRRSDGSHQYIVGNTHYSFLSGYGPIGRPSGNNIAADIAANARYFKKLRFGLTGDRYAHPTDMPFLDASGRPTDRGDCSCRPNPKWFRERVDVAVRTAFEHDLIADLILAGPDTENSRATLRARDTGGDAGPYLRYVAARYGSYPNVWLCLCNEFDIKTPRYAAADIARFGQIIRQALPYPTPLSVHASQHPDHGPREATQPAWATAFDTLPPWNDHQIIQRKLKTIPAAADANARTGQRRSKPTINDELSYEGDGDGHSAADTIEAHLGAFLGGGYGSTGHKSGNKLGQYFWGKFDTAEHTAADSLGWLRKSIDAGIPFWRMEPDARVFTGLRPGFRAMAWPEREYVLGTNKSATGLLADLPPGTWTVKRFDVVARRETILSASASGRFSFDAPDSRAVLFHFRKND